MKLKKMAHLLFCALIVLGAGACEKETPTGTQPVTASYSKTEHPLSFPAEYPGEPPLENDAQVQIKSVTAGPTGIKVTLKVTHMAVLAFNVKQLVPTGKWIPIVPAIWINPPNDLIKTSEEVEGTVTLPVLVEPNASAQYQLQANVKSANSSDMLWNTDNSDIFNGYTPEPFQLNFGSDALTISATSSDVETLKAAWHYGQGVPTDMVASKTQESPSVGLPYSTLHVSDGKDMPSLFLELTDANGQIREQARVAITVDVSPGMKKKIQDSTKTNNSNTKFSWGDFAKTGIGAVLRYFLTTL